MTFYHYTKPYRTQSDGSKLVGAVRFNRALYTVEVKRQAKLVVLVLLPVFVMVYHPLDKDIQEALLECWRIDREAAGYKSL